jgi:hypothetical protein
MRGRPEHGLEKVRGATITPEAIRAAARALKIEVGDELSGREPLPVFESMVRTVLKAVGLAAAPRNKRM